MRSRAYLAVVLLCPAAAAAGEGARLSASSRLAFEQPAAVPATGPAGESEDPVTPAPRAFGEEGYRSFGVTVGVAHDLEDDDRSTDIQAALSLQYFFVDDIEIIGELSALGFFQEGDDAAGVNAGFVLRWHFVNRDRWSLFGDAGIGLLFTTDDVPDGGTSFNFTPRAGLGATYRLTDGGVRLVAGARWHHVSNAAIDGEDRNPDRDGIMGYVGLTFPF